MDGEHAHYVVVDGVSHDGGGGSSFFCAVLWGLHPANNVRRGPRRILQERSAPDPTNTRLASVTKFSANTHCLRVVHVKCAAHHSKVKDEDSGFTFR